ncbi:hypothetical protein EYF80_013109 [Liparis tanakae]|uniref:Uncharacterized protein n=1 Tax=Liparis tanakae TaxID=230148 RepID=A0A4Z2IFQ1_9TELE|nr:hypothetical protein EYF80_013109 [Liparis tanakae]
MDANKPQQDENHSLMVEHGASNLQTHRERPAVEKVHGFDLAWKARQYRGQGLFDWDRCAPPARAPTGGDALGGLGNSCPTFKQCFWLPPHPFWGLWN